MSAVEPHRRPPPPRHREPCGCAYVQVKGKWWQVEFCHSHLDGFAWEGKPVSGTAHPPQRGEK